MATGTREGWKVSVTYIGRPNARKVGRIVKEGLQELVKYWYLKILKKHFRRDASNKYGYKSRQAGYNRLKVFLQGKTIKKWGKRALDRPVRIERGQPRPIALSGATRRVATRRGMRISGTSQRARGAFNVPWYVTMGKNARQLVAELTRTTQAEADAMAKQLDAYIEAALAADTTTERKVLS